ncbi:hypothetical protein DIPPA_33615 [Diplonema papillatum]|nr:hypothetical protein DIPPA_33615 [Diplonema papillatum]
MEPDGAGTMPGTPEFLHQLMREYLMLDPTVRKNDKDDASESEDSEPEPEAEDPLRYTNATCLRTTAARRIDRSRGGEGDGL